MGFNPPYPVPGLLVQVYTSVQRDSLDQIHGEHLAARQLINHLRDQEEVVSLQHGPGGRTETDRNTPRGAPGRWTRQQRACPQRTTACHASLDPGPPPGPSTPQKKKRKREKNKKKREGGGIGEEEGEEEKKRKKNNNKKNKKNKKNKNKKEKGVEEKNEENKEEKRKRRKEEEEKEEEDEEEEENK
ncbi:hypothetical protein EYF80_043625 [Liparis tanakae]|uniref:Uncharacterized protein n=1 Tax=Liparis tanakae TaxID=230148 RepID=A0A4Z2FY32_9TELE|nr:hypothetical protein EYF80_043625 [Liparis tanakae]